MLCTQLATSQLATVQLYSCHFPGLGANFPEFHEWAPTLATSVLTGLFLELFYISNALYSQLYSYSYKYLSMVHTCKTILC